MAKYKTKAEALAALKLDGKRLYDVENHLRDDEDVVMMAIKHGGQLDHASARLQNDPRFLLAEAKASPDNVQFYYNKALFCAKRDWDLCQKFTRFYKKADEFQIEMCLIYGDKYLATIRKYNFMTPSELKKALVEYRHRVVRDAREIYVKGYDADYISEHEELYIVAGHSSLHWGAVALREEGNPFSDISTHYERQIESEKRQIDSYCSESLSGSYPERVINSLLNLLSVDFAREQVFPWSTNVLGEDGNTSTKRYDFYIPSMSAIIEVHGSQHYGDGFEGLGGRTLEEEQANDRQKEQLAKDNGIKNYIVINALTSTLEYIKQSIETNDVFTALFDISNIDWDNVEAGTVAKVKTDIAFPFYEELSQRYSEWTEVIKASLTDKDYVALPSTKKAQRENVSAALIKNLEGCTPSKRGLYPHELLILSEAEGYRYPVNPDNVSGKWFYEYDINDVSFYFNKLMRDGFLTTGDIRASVEHSTLPIIKRVLTEHGLSTKGKKAELVELLLEKVAHDELEQVFVEKYLKRTPLGEQELAENTYVTTKNRCGLSIWTLNRLQHAFPNDNIENILLAYCDNSRRFLKFLSEGEREILGITYSEKPANNVPKHQDRNTALNAAGILQKSGKQQEALERLLYIMLLDLSAPDYDSNEKEDIHFYFPYEKSLARVAPGIVRMANKNIAYLELTQGEIKALLHKIFNEFNVSSNIFTFDECVDIIISELSEDNDRIGQIYRLAERRIKGGTKETVLHKTISQKAVRTTPVKVHAVNREESRQYNTMPSKKTASINSRKENVISKSPRISSSVKNSKDSIKNLLPRKGFLIPAYVLLGFTAMFFLVSLSQPNMWFGFCCFGILSGMLFAMAFSTKEAPCLFGKNHGIPKKLFVIVCSIVAFLMPILSSYFE